MQVDWVLRGLGWACVIFFATIAARLALGL
jgi:hypothetical protein